MFDFALPSSPALAAIDLGSNSFRLEVGQVLPDGYRKLHCRKEMVSLGAGLDAGGRLSGEAIERGLRCVRKFAADLAVLSPDRVRVVATQTLREARNRDEFLRHAEALLGLPVELISGHEEGRLIFAGVSFLHPSPRRRLVIDIGGRSTEMIVGQHRTARAISSFPIGSGSLSQQHFPQGRITAEGFRAAQHAAAAVLSPALDGFAAVHWDEAMASSGTAGTVSAVLRRNGITDGTLTPAALRWLIERCIAAGHVEQLDLPGLKEKRRPVLPGGLAILYTLLARCGIAELQSAKAALRQGVIVDLHERAMPAAARAPRRQPALIPA
ncbi:Ppx/GppA family phosphatase [Paucibacter sp. R3-3]|uniref:Ppx/GppA family phosphatase n=1 Tax=Roseateles agri TaxID=3098619 RepID=A0ABU5DHB0_9BURK|nr:Ppx/GppA family phosphatase [Paucibacter sp. R3-3]MDY0745128.1 Ppx/GppA family phosphatase [Paucibacter sp. R3-3]